MLLDKDAGAGSTTERFEAKCAGTGEKIEHAGTIDGIGKDREKRLSDEISGGSGY